MSFAQRYDANNSIEGDFSQLEEMLRQLEADYYTDVGVLGDGAAELRGELTTAQIGAVHEFGSADGRIPRRSFIVEPIELGQDQIEQAVAPLIERNLAEGRVLRIYEQLGIAAEAVIQEAFETRGNGRWAPLSENYTRRPSGQPVSPADPPLQDTGILRQSITSITGEGGAT